MKENLKEASRIVNANIALVLLVGVCNIRILSGVMIYVTFVGLIISFLVGVILFGRISAEASGSKAQSGLNILKENWLNYIVVSLLLAIPVITFGLIEGLLPETLIPIFVLKEGLYTIIGVVTIYVLPIVFLKNESVVAIFAGISFLRLHLRKSMPVMMLVIFSFVIYIFSTFLLKSFFESAENVFFIAPLVIVTEVFVTYLSYLVFAMASIVMVRTRKPNLM